MLRKQSRRKTGNEGLMTRGDLTLYYMLISYISAAVSIESQTLYGSEEEERRILIEGILSNV